jgi:aromatic-amino-acid transaminase
VLLHACCHNPTGVDLTPISGTEVIDVVNKRGLVPFLDIAYQGFADSLEADAAAVRRFAEAGPAGSSCPARSRNRSRCTANASAR